MLTKIAKKRREYFDNNAPYEMIFYNLYNYEILSRIPVFNKSGRGGNQSYNDCIIMADTETSKKARRDTKENHICAWTISIRCLERNIVTLWGRTPSEMMQCISMIMSSMHGDETYIYLHNMSYDYQFLRLFLFRAFGYPVKQLSTKPHYPIYFKFENGLILRDSLILAQRSLDKWAKDLGVEHQKAVGKWEYNKIRNQNEDFTADELEYIEHDTLAGVECLDALRIALNKSIYSMPWTATGIPREEAREIGKKNRAHDRFVRMAPTKEQLIKLMKLFHGGFTHGNRYFIDTVIDWMETFCKDFSSSYPFVMLTEKFPCEKFGPYKDCSIDDILKLGKTYAFMFKLIMIKPDLKSYENPMPALQFSKCVSCINPILDNGRVICADYVEIYLNEVDLQIIAQQYKSEKHICTEVEFALKAYLDRWFTDYIYSLYEAKTKLKGGDIVQYMLAKAKLNSLYGMCVQRPIRENLIEDFETGEYITEEPPEDAYDKYVNNKNSFLSYAWGVWTTSYAFRNLFMLGHCVDSSPDQNGNQGIWVYSDTDSIYATRWNPYKVEAYNEVCRDKLRANGYGPVIHNGREYWLGVAEDDGHYSEFVCQGAKRYACRDAESGKLKITVAGVPKKGAECLEDDINKFKKGFIFSGKITGKLTHNYIFVDDIYIDEDGNETGDSINLESCDYLLDNVYQNWDKILKTEVSHQVYEEE